MLKPSPAAAAVLAGDRRSAGRLISRAEAGDPTIEPDLGLLYRHGGRSRIIGVTGPPGVGKSTFISQLLTVLRSRGQRVAVLAVDPTSPRSGGAVLGDRVRMHSHSGDSGVLIRSIAARGALGGLSVSTGDSLTILDAMGFDTIIVETVGVGQSEVDIAHHAEPVILLQTAQSGDGVQAVKAGVLEIADIIVVNRGDLPGTRERVHSLRQMLGNRRPTAGGWETPVLIADSSSGTGIAAALDAVDGFFTHRSQYRTDAAHRDRTRLHRRILLLAQTLLQRQLASPDHKALGAAVDAVLERRSDPHAAATLLVRSQQAGDYRSADARR